MDINQAISDESVVADALIIKNKLLMVENAQLRARVEQLEQEVKANAKPKTKPRGKK